MNAHILLVEDDDLLAEAIQDALEANDYAVTHAEDGDFALDLVEEQSFDLVLTDFRMGVMSGLELLEKIKEVKPKLPVIMMTAHGTTDLAIEATKMGAFDYIIKPFEMPDLFGILDKAVASSRLTAKPIAMGESVAGRDSIIGTSRPMQEVFKEVGRIAAMPITVLIKGETGTGKELIARAIYQHSRRSKKPFVAVNCAAIPDSLIESELFGHEKGAFTNAIAQRIGRFEQANNGTLFLDEIGDLPWETQVKLLRVLQEKTIQRIGGKDDIEVNVRVISATHRDLEKMILDGKFREDLFYRLNAAMIELPSLRERSSDIQQLSDYFFSKYATEFELEPPAVHKDASILLQEHDWPGNVRQLENVVRRALVDAQGMTIGKENVAASLRKTSQRRIPKAVDGGSEMGGFAEHIAERLRNAQDEDEGSGRGAFELLVEDLEQELYKQAVELSHGNQTKIAKWVGVSRLTVREKLDKYQLFPKRGG
ncbi:MAG: DNA-binding NtrC family response regulator [Verrucomicrobiales bacterium]|jgi:DNA-binding NtrC family response regulator